LPRMRCALLLRVKRFRSADAPRRDGRKHFFHGRCKTSDREPVLGELCLSQAARGSARHRSLQHAEGTSAAMAADASRLATNRERSTRSAATRQTANLGIAYRIRREADTTDAKPMSGCGPGQTGAGRSMERGEPFAPARSCTPSNAAVRTFQT
jgi:hypothetical protein